MKADASTAASVSPRRRNSPALNRTTDLIRRLGRRLARQDGIALVMVIGISLVLGITGTTAMIYSTENVRAASTSRADERVFLARRGRAQLRVRDALQRVRPADAGRRPDAERAGRGRHDHVVGHARHHDEHLDAHGPRQRPEPQRRHRRDPHRSRCARASSTPPSARRTTRSGTTSTPTRRRRARPSPTRSTSTSRFYIRGNLCLQNTAQISGSNTVLQVGGTLTIEQLVARRHARWRRLAEVHIAGGCRVGNGALHNPCGVADSVYSSAPPDAVTPELREASGRSPLLVLELEAGARSRPARRRPARRPRSTTTGR